MELRRFRCVVVQFLFLGRFVGWLKCGQYFVVRFPVSGFNFSGYCLWSFQAAVVSPPNYAFKPTAAGALRPIQPFSPRRLNAALDFI